MRTKVGMIQQNNIVIDGINLRTEEKRITPGQCKALTSCLLLDGKKLTSCLLLDNAKKLTSCQKFRCKFSYLPRLIKFSRNFEKLISENVDF